MKQEEIFTNKYLVPLMAGITSLIWGSAFPALKISFELLKMSNDDLFLKMLFASYRFFIASLLLFSIQIIKDGFSSIKIKKRNISSLIILGLLQTTLQYFFFYNGLANTSGVKAPILSTSSIFFIVIASHFIYKDDKLNLQKIFGLILGLIGVIIVNLARGHLDLQMSFLGEGFIISAGIVITFASFLAKKISYRIDPLLVTAYQMFFGAIALFLFSITRVKPCVLDFTGKSYLLLIYLSFISAMGFGIFYTLFKYNPLGKISMYKFITPVSGVLFSIIFLSGEGLSLNLIIALIFVSAGIIIVNYKEKVIVSTSSID